MMLTFSGQYREECLYREVQCTWVVCLNSVVDITNLVYDNDKYVNIRQID